MARVTAVPERRTGTWRRLLAATVVALLWANACGGSDEQPRPSPKNDAAAEHDSTQSSDSGEAGVGVDLCATLGDKASGHLYDVANDYVASVFKDCRVLQILIPLTQSEGNDFLNKLSAWTGQFMGCDPGGVTTFGPADTGKFPTLSQTDVDVLSQLYVDQLEIWMTLSPAQKKLVQDQLAPLAKAAVNTPVDGPSLSLCSDAAPDAPAESSLEGSSDDAPAEAATDATLDSTSSDGSNGDDASDSGASD